MPMHDWTRVTPNDDPDFQFTWLGVLKSVLNDGLLPAGSYAMADPTTPLAIPDVVTLALAEPGGGSERGTGRVLPRWRTRPRRTSSPKPVGNDRPPAGGDQARRGPQDRGRDRGRVPEQQASSRTESGNPSSCSCRA